MKTYFDLSNIHPSWHKWIEIAMQHMDANYLQQLSESNDWLPGPQHIFNAFSLPVDDTHYIMFGESPYPRAVSANGYAFWDENVTDIWSPLGLSKQVNRATSLRNMIKMLLVAEHLLTPNATDQTAIANIDKSALVKTNAQFFGNFIEKGFLLLNASLVLRDSNKRKDAKAWQPFIATILDFICKIRPQTQLVLFGQIANEITPLLPAQLSKRFYAEHPYNISFIQNPEVISFFQPLRLLRINPGK